MISIITINYNNALGLERTLESISKQTCKDFELIVVDGFSTDSFTAVVKKYSSIITKMVSEKDRGIAHAFNKGIRMSEGQWLLFLNSGDYFKDENSLRNAVLNFDCNYDFIQFNVQVVNVELNPLFIIPKYRGSKIHSMAHQGLFHNKDFFLKAGEFSESYKISMDTDMELRYKNVKIKFCDEILSCMPNDGLSSKNAIRSFREDMACYLLNLDNKSVFFIVRLYYWRLLKFYVKKLFRFV